MKAGLFAGAAVLGAAVLGVWFALRHPRTTTVTGAAVAAYLYLGPDGLVLTLGTLAVLGVAWRWGHRASFDWCVLGPWRRATRYSWRWSKAIPMCGLDQPFRPTHTGIDEGLGLDRPRSRRYLPKLKRVRSDQWYDRVTVRLLAGQHPGMWEDCTDHLAHTFGAMACRVDDHPDPADEDDQGDDEDADPERRVRSTRRRQDAPDLPRAPMDDRTIGRVFTAPDGRTYRPSMFLTLTLDSYGPVTSEGAPVHPASYDYGRAALDALHFSKLVDRFMQNLRRCPGYKVQYFATVEAQRRLAPHLHAAIRGAIPRKIVREVRAATYHQVWWPPHDTPVYEGDRLPVWSDAGYVDSDTGASLPTWDEALDDLDADPDAEPAHVVRFGAQDDIKGLTAGRPDTDRTIGYLCKYLTKSIAATHDDEDVSPARDAHIDRLADEVRWLPCSPGCSNWLRFGVQPKGARAGMVPGHCPGKAHDRANLGLGGRRVLVSRMWSGKTLAGHKADRAAVVRAALEEAGIDPDDHDELAVTGSDGQWSWEVIPRSRVEDRTYAAAVATAITTRQRWRHQYETAKAAGRGQRHRARREFGSSATGEGA